MCTASFLTGSEPGQVPPALFPRGAINGLTCMQISLEAQNWLACMQIGQSARNWRSTKTMTH